MMDTDNMEGPLSMARGGGGIRNKNKRGRDDDDDGQEEDQPRGLSNLARNRASQQANANTAAAGNPAKRQKKQSHHEDHVPGMEYRAKNAGGDVKRANQQFEPYAFIPLHGKLLSKKHREGAMKQYKSVVGRKNSEVREKSGGRSKHK